MKKLSEITNRLYGQPMFKLLSIAQQLESKGKRIIHFEIGDPSFPSPQSAVNAACAALQGEQTHYTNSMGLLELRQAIVEHTEQELGFRPDLSQVLICSANTIIDFAIRCIANPGDKVLLPDPGFATYYSVLNSNDITPVGVPLYEINDFRMKPEDVSSRITGKTKMIVINSPHNPTGAVMDEADIMAIARIAEENDLFLLSDEVYAKLLFEREHCSPTTIDHCRERSILLQSFSKNYSMTGWRVGYAIGPERLIEKMGLLLQGTLSCLPAFTQVGAIAALSEAETIIPRIQELKARRDRLVDGLNAIDGLKCLKPDGAFYVFPRLESKKMTGFEYSERLLHEEGLCLLPGSSFGEHGRGYLRLSYSNVDIEQIEEALEKLQRFHQRHF